MNKRVKVYATLNSVVAETKGTILQTREDGIFLVELDRKDGEVSNYRIWAHPKQCRVLKPKAFPIPSEVFVRCIKVATRGPETIVKVDASTMPIPGFYRYIFSPQKDGCPE